MSTSDSVTATGRTGAPVLLVAAFALLLPTPAPAAPEGQTADLPAGYAAAAKAYRAGRFAESLETIRKSVSASYMPYEMRMLAAATYVKLGKPANAVAHLQLCIKEHPKRSEPRLALTGVYRGMGRFAEAIVVAKRAMVEAPDRNRARLELARAYYGAAQFERSREQVAAILKEQPKHAESVMLDGLNLLRQGKLENAEFRLQQALHLKPDSRADLAATYNNLGLCYEVRARRLPKDQAKAAREYFDEAVRYYRYALETIPKYAPAERNLARVRPGQ